VPFTMPWNTLMGFFQGQRTHPSTLLKLYVNAKLVYVNMPKLVAEVRERFQRLMTSEEFTWRKLTRESRIGRKTWLRMMENPRGRNRDTIIKMAEYLGIDVSEYRKLPDWLEEPPGMDNMLEWLHHITKLDRRYEKRSKKGAETFSDREDENGQRGYPLDNFVPTMRKGYNLLWERKFRAGVVDDFRPEHMDLARVARVLAA